MEEIKLFLNKKFKTIREIFFDTLMELSGIQSRLIQIGTPIEVKQYMKLDKKTAYKILIADDDENIRNSLNDILKLPVLG